MEDKYFTEDMYYVLQFPGTRWEDYDGPFASLEDGIRHLQRLVDPNWASPELVNGLVLVQFKDNVLNLVKNDDGSIIDGRYIFLK